jgi:hypothetical protein
MNGRLSLIRDLARLGVVTASAIAVLTAAWIVSLVLVPAPAAEAGLGEKLQFLADHPATATVGPGLVAGIALLHVPVWLGLAAVLWSRRPAAGLVALAFGLVYAPLASINYWTQLTVVRGLADLGGSDAPAAAAAYRLFEFPGGLASFAYGLDVLAYVVWGLAALAAAIGLVALEGRVARSAGLAFATGGVLALVGGLGFVVQNDVLELGVLLSGVAFLVAMTATAVLLWQASRAAEEPLAELRFELRASRPA